uniref:Gsp-co-occurring protein 10 n=1 Tax=Malawimonas jakobiformis TaxID=136089 RepID=A0A895KQ84_MALJA|nr:Gsp-co-occurring protein 10 [Malawimonas jakobiformis]
MLALVAGLVGLVTYKFLRSSSASESAPPVRVGEPSLTAKQSYVGQKDPKKDIRERQQQAIKDYFRDTGGKITDLRVLRSAMYLSDEIDRAVRGLDEANQHVGWRQYNRFFAEGIEDVFTNVPSGRSQLVLAAPTGKVTDFQQAPEGVRPVQYKASRDALLQQIARTVDLVEQRELLRLADKEADKLSLAQRAFVEQHRRLQARAGGSMDAAARAAAGTAATSAAATVTVDRASIVAREIPLPPAARRGGGALMIRPRAVPYQPKVSRSLRSSVFQPYVPASELDGGGDSIRRRLIRFEGDIAERRPDLDAKNEGFEG